MPDLRIETLKDADIEDSIRLQYIAFRSPPGIGRLLSPIPDPPDEYVVSTSTRRREAMRDNPAARFMGVFDNSTGQLIACGHWNIYTTERTQEQVDELTHISPVPSGVNPELWNDFFGNFSERRQTLLGNRPVAILRTLVTHPDHYRRGAGGLLMEQFVKDADSEGLEGYIEASDMGKPLYARFGFSPVSVMDFHLEKYGGTGVAQNTVMIREPRSTSSQ
jgi:GNAT superfamily N-acetyltransferase